MWGREGKEAVGMGIREGELKPVRLCDSNAFFYKEFGERKTLDEMLSIRC